MKLKRFVSCGAKQKQWKLNNLKENEDHLIIYCKDLKKLFTTWNNIDDNVQRITVNVPTDDPHLSVNPFFMSLKVKLKIKEIHFNCYTHDFWLQLILDLCPNIEILSFYKLTKEKVRHAAENFEHLKHIYCDYIEEGTEEYYKELKSVTKDINENIKIN